MRLPISENTNLHPISHRLPCIAQRLSLELAWICALYKFCNNNNNNNNKIIALDRECLSLTIRSSNLKEYRHKLRVAKKLNSLDYIFVADSMDLSLSIFT